MKYLKLTLTTFVITATTFIFSCSKSATSDLHDVQLCLNKASASSALACVDKISGDSSPLAFSLRCSAIFISEGYGDAASFVNALDSINGESNGCSGSCSSTVSALTALKFTAADVSTGQGRIDNNAAAANAFTQCSQADAKIYTQIASLFKLGTITAMLAYATGIPAGTPLTDTDIQTQLTNLDDATVGEIVTTTYANTCQDTTNASDSTKSYCAELKKAIDAGSTNIIIGACLKHKLDDPNYNTPPCL